MKIGYIRVSRNSQLTDLQKDAMEKENVERTFVDHMSGKRFDRPEFMKMLDVVRRGDTVVVWRLDRLGRSLQHLIETVQLLNEKGVELRSLRENIDTTTSSGKLMFHVIGALAEFERDLISERTQAGLEAARSRGKVGGRRPVTARISETQLQRAKELYTSRAMTVPKIIEECKLKMSVPSFYKHIVRKNPPSE